MQELLKVFSKKNWPNIQNKQGGTLISNIEITMMKGKTDQVMNEMIPIRRHLLNDLSRHKDAFAVFIAPYIHSDAKDASEWYKHKDNIDINPYTIEEFIDKISANDKLISLNERQSEK